jgi:hypothetical protein
MPGLFPATQYPREPYTPERVIVQLIFFKCCAPKVGDRELARVVHNLTGHRLDHHTVKGLCERFFFWRHPEFQQLVRYPVPTDPQALRLEVVRLSQQGWTETRTAELLRISRKTVRRWLRRARQQAQQIESQFGIQARIGEYHWERCQSVESAVEFHRDLIRDHNRLPHWAHSQRQLIANKTEKLMPLSRAFFTWLFRNNKLRGARGDQFCSSTCSP